MRRTPLKPGKPLKRGEPMKRGGPIKSRSARGDAYAEELNGMRPVIAARSGGRCEGRVGGVCSERAAHVHHRKLRKQGGDNSAINLLDLCEPCHTWAHGHPAQANAMGLIVLSWQDPAVVPVNPAG